MRNQSVAGIRHVRGTSLAVVLPLAAALLGGWPVPARAAPKTDIVVLMNGDRITGEIKGLEYNQLKVSTD